MRPMTPLVVGIFAAVMLNLGSLVTAAAHHRSPEESGLLFLDQEEHQRLGFTQRRQELSQFSYVLRKEGVDCWAGCVLLVGGMVALSLKCLVPPDNVEESARVRSSIRCHQVFTVLCPVFVLCWVGLFYVPFAAGVILGHEQSKQRSAATFLILLWIGLVVLVFQYGGWESGEEEEVEKSTITAPTETAQIESVGKTVLAASASYQRPMSEPDLRPLTQPTPSLRPATEINLRRVGELPAARLVRFHIMKSMKANLSMRELDDITRAFRASDLDGDGTISMDELDQSLRTIGIIVDRPTLRTLVSEVDLDGDGFIDINEYVSTAMKAMPASQSDQLLEKAFEEFDKNKEGRSDGVIDAVDLHMTMVRHLASTISEQDAEAVITQSCGNKVWTRAEFKRFALMLPA